MEKVKASVNQLSLLTLQSTCLLAALTLALRRGKSKIAVITQLTPPLTYVLGKLFGVYFFAVKNKPREEGREGEDWPFV